jgi:hypothetical protein
MVIPLGTTTYMPPLQTATKSHAYRITQKSKQTIFYSGHFAILAALYAYVFYDRSSHFKSEDTPS